MGIARCPAFLTKRGKGAPVCHCSERAVLGVSWPDGTASKQWHTVVSHCGAWYAPYGGFTPSLRKGDANFGRTSYHRFGTAGHRGRYPHAGGCGPLCHGVCGPCAGGGHPHQPRWPPSAECLPRPFMRPPGRWTGHIDAGGWPRRPPASLRHFPLRAASKSRPATILPYNGLKLFSAEGRVIPGGRARKCWNNITRTPPWAPHDQMGGAETELTRSRPICRRSGTVTPTDSQTAVPRGVGFQSRGRQPLGAGCEELDCHVTSWARGPGLGPSAEPTAETWPASWRPCRKAGPTSASARTPTPTVWP